MMLFPHKSHFLWNPATQNGDIIPNKKQEENNNCKKEVPEFIHKKALNHLGALHSITEEQPISMNIHLPMIFFQS